MTLYEITISYKATVFVKLMRLERLEDMPISNQLPEGAVISATEIDDSDGIVTFDQLQKRGA